MLVGVFSEHSVLSVSPSCPLAAPVMRPDSLPRLWRYINLLLTYLLTYI